MFSRRNFTWEIHHNLRMWQKADFDENHIFAKNCNRTYSNHGS